MTRRPATRDETFSHRWQAEILPAAPMIAPAAQYVYPQAVEEVERGALQILLQSDPDSPPALLTFALGFADTSLPHGIWSCPNPDQICAVAGGYAYIADANNPKQWMQVPYRPVTAVYAVAAENRLIFAGFHQLWALGPGGKHWETARLTWEGLRVTEIGNGKLVGYGWDLPTDREMPFVVDLATGHHTGGVSPK